MVNQIQTEQRSTKGAGNPHHARPAPNGLSAGFGPASLAAGRRLQGGGLRPWFFAAARGTHSMPLMCDNYLGAQDTPNARRRRELGQTGRHGCPVARTTKGKS